MDIGSGNGYPSSALSNFAPHPFIFDDVQCASMEGLLQSFKFKSVEMQEYVCTLVGIKAKYKGKYKKWWVDQTLYWKGKPITRHSDEYQTLLNNAFFALATNEGFCKALLATNNATLTHNIGKTNASQTVLTTTEFCSRLLKIRKLLKEKQCTRLF